MIWPLLSFTFGFLISKKINSPTKKHWCIKENYKYIKLNCSDVINYLHDDYLLTQDTVVYEFIDFTVDFEKNAINLHDEWFPLYHINKP